MLRGAPAPPDVPAAVLVSDEPYDLTAMAVDGRLPNGAPADFGATVFDAHLAGQLELAAQFGVTPLLRTQAGHYIQTEQPDLTVEVVKTVVAQSRPGDRPIRASGRSALTPPHADRVMHTSQSEQCDALDKRGHRTVTFRRSSPRGPALIPFRDPEA